MRLHRRLVKEPDGEPPPPQTHASHENALMSKTILITGSTDGIGLEAARMLGANGHTVLLHGRNREKLGAARQALPLQARNVETGAYLADLSRMEDVEAFARAVAADHAQIDVLINNAGVYSLPSALTADGLDARFAVNAIAPYLLTQRLLPLIPDSGRIINLSSAAQAPVSPEALVGPPGLSTSAAYAQSKLAITMWTRALANANPEGPAFIAVNPGSLLGTKMVREGFGVAGGDVRIGAKILVEAATSDEFADASGKYFDNDNAGFAPPHPDALDTTKSNAIVQAIEAWLAR